ncbi:repetitive large surface protein [Neisseria animalis]|nr:repetitive large surface protein [Neisseria animalis]
MSLHPLQKISALTIIALSLTACSSNNSNPASISTNTQTAIQKTTTEKAAAEKAAAEKAAAEKAAAEKAAAEKAAAEKAAAEKAAAEKAAAEKAAAEKAAAEKAAAEKAAAEKAAAEKAAAEKAAAEKAAAEKAAAEKAAAEKAAAEKAAAEKAAAEKAAAEKAAAEKAAAEKAAAEKAAAEKAAAEKAAAEKAAAEKIKINDDIRIATALQEVPEEYRDTVLESKTRNLDASQEISAFFKDLGMEPPSKNTRFYVDGKEILSGEYVIEPGFHENVLEIYDEATKEHTYIHQIRKAYSMPYSIVTGWVNSVAMENNTVKNESNEFVIAFDDIRGLATAQNAIPTQGRAVYEGAAFDKNSQGLMSYTIDFNNRSGNGSITGLQLGNIILKEGSLETLNKTLIHADADINGKPGSYFIGLYGPNAEEVAGVLYDVSKEEYRQNQNHEGIAGFGGKRGEIQ